MPRKQRLQLVRNVVEEQDRTEEVRVQAPVLVRGAQLRCVREPRTIVGQVLCRRRRKKFLHSLSRAAQSQFFPELNGKRKERIPAGISGDAQRRGGQEAEEKPCCSLLP